MYTLHDGREVVFNFHAVTISEWRSMFNPKQTPEDEAAVLGKIWGMTAAEVMSMSYADYRLASAAMFEIAKNPLSDPNSASESTDQ